jgi:hypothetical protein
MLSSSWLPAILYLSSSPALNCMPHSGSRRQMAQAGAGCSRQEGWQSTTNRYLPGEGCILLVGIGPRALPRSKGSLCRAQAERPSLANDGRWSGFQHIGNLWSSERCQRP